VQERLTNQISAGLKEALQSEDVAIIIDTVHLYVASRGIKDTDSSSITTNYSGQFLCDKRKTEFLSLINTHT